MDQTLLQTVLAVVAGGLIIPLVGGIKQTVVANYIRPEFLTTALLVGVAYLVTHFAAPTMPIAEVIQLGLAAAGSAGVIYAGTVKGGKANKNDHSTR